MKKITCTILDDPTIYDVYPVQEMRGYDLYICVQGNIELRSNEHIDLMLEDAALFRTIRDWRSASMDLSRQKIPQVIHDVYDEFHTRLSFTEHGTVKFECTTAKATLCWAFETLEEFDSMLTRGAEDVFLEVKRKLPMVLDNPIFANVGHADQPIWDII